MLSIFKLIKYLFFFSSLSFILSCSTVETTSDSTEYPDHLIDVTIDGYSDTAIIGINLNTSEDSSSQSAGDISFSKSNSILSKIHTHTHENNKIKDIPQSNKMMLYSHHSPQKKLSINASIDDSTTSHTFYTYNFTTPSSPHEISSTKRYDGTNCYIFVDDDHTSSITDSLINTLGANLDTYLASSESTFSQTPYYIDQNDKTVILYADLNYTGSGTLMGYFWTEDLMDANDASYYSNELAMIYMNVDLGIDYDTNPTDNDQTVVHEYQHLLNYSNRLDNSDSNFYDTWIEEGIAEGAAYYIVGTPLTEHFDSLSSSSSIYDGLGLISWSSSGADYSLSYTFFEYCRIQSNADANFYKTLMTQYQTSGDDYLAVIDLVDTYIDGTFDDFDDLLVSYRIANIARESTGIYGYKDEYSISNIPEPTSSSSITLGSGGAIYYYPTDEEIDDFVPTNIDSDIYFYRINYSE